jgi:succinate-semialdehyde dehydrogenase / glutarate-semialdehyde dehydrogenase
MGCGGITGVTAKMSAKLDSPSAAPENIHLELNDQTLLRQHCFVGGEWIGTPEIAVTDPATGDIIGRVPRFSVAETRHAIEAANKALAGWAKMTGKARAKIMRDWFELIIANRQDIALIMTTEQGKPLAEALGEVDYAAAFVEFNGEEAKRIYGQTSLSHREDARIVVLKQPIGVVGAITPWNFPAAMITRKCAPAIAAGCTIVCKPAGETPLTALALAVLAERAGLPPGVFNVITGTASEIGEELATSTLVRCITFTGSTEIGKLLMRQAASTVKKVALELGGNAPFIVFEDADIDAAVEGAMFSKFRNMGQTCVCANRMLVQDAVYEEFSTKLAIAVEKLKVGRGTEAGVAQGPLINEAGVAKVEQHVKDATGKGAKVLVGGHRHKLGGTFFEPTVLGDVTPGMLVSREETFGPVPPLYRFRTEREAIDLANATEFGLAAYFYGRDLGCVWRVAEALEYGMVGINTGAISTELAPFGGVKESGIGREGSHYGIEEFVEVKYLLMGGLDR